MNLGKGGGEEEKGVKGKTEHLGTSKSLALSILRVWSMIRGCNLGEIKASVLLHSLSEEQG